MSFPVQNIRDAAKAKGLTLKSIEQALNIGNGVIAKWAKNRSYPPYDRIVAIADFLDVPVSQLTGDGEETKKPAPEGEPNKAALLKAVDTMSREELIQMLNKISQRLTEV